MTTHLTSTSELASALGTSPASVYAYINARTGQDERYWSVPEAHYFVGSRSADGEVRNVPLWTAADVAAWRVWYKNFLTQRYQRSPKQGTDV